MGGAGLFFSVVGALFVAEGASPTERGGVVSAAEEEEFCDLVFSYTLISEFKRLKTPNLSIFYASYATKNFK